MGKIISCYNAPMKVFDPEMPDRAPGLHQSTIISEIATDLYPRWFKKWEDSPEDLQRHVTHFEKGLVLEHAWGNSLAEMIGAPFLRPEPREKDGVHVSPDGYAWDDELSDIDNVEWPVDYPAYMAPAIHECKVTLKSCNEATSPITHEKYLTWQWQMMGYCYVWECQTAFLHVLHLCGNYKDKPWTPMAAVHRFDWTAEELEAHWHWLLEEAEKRGLRD